MRGGLWERRKGEEGQGGRGRREAAVVRAGCGLRACVRHLRHVACLLTSSAARCACARDTLAGATCACCSAAAPADHACLAALLAPAHDSSAANTLAVALQRAPKSLADAPCLFCPPPPSVVRNRDNSDNGPPNSILQKAILNHINFQTTVLKTLPDAELQVCLLAPNVVTVCRLHSIA